MLQGNAVEAWLTWCISRGAAVGRAHVHESSVDQDLVHIVVSAPRVRPGTGGVDVTRTQGEGWS